VYLILLDWFKKQVKEKQKREKQKREKQKREKPKNQCAKKSVDFLILFRTFHNFNIHINKWQLLVAKPTD
jgi:hypothetical protein